MDNGSHSKIIHTLACFAKFIFITFFGISQFPYNLSSISINIMKYQNLFPILTKDECTKILSRISTSTGRTPKDALDRAIREIFKTRLFADDNRNRNRNRNPQNLVPTLFSIEQGDLIENPNIAQNETFKYLMNWLELSAECDQPSMILPMVINMIKQTTNLVDQSTSLCVAWSQWSEYNKAGVQCTIDECSCFISGLTSCCCGYTGGGGVIPPLPATIPNVIKQLQLFENVLVYATYVIYELEIKPYIHIPRSPITYHYDDGLNETDLDHDQLNLSFLIQDTVDAIDNCRKACEMRLGDKQLLFARFRRGLLFNYWRLPSNGSLWSSSVLGDDDEDLRPNNLSSYMQNDNSTDENGVLIVQNHDAVVQLTQNYPQGEINVVQNTESDGLQNNSTGLDVDVVVAVQNTEPASLDTHAGYTNSLDMNNAVLIDQNVPNPDLEFITQFLNLS
ncbi:unnamed protein product [Ambrosiozyma monospora]|uniref:Unnamed protein product n=1 Tax=Ambrosiozyma monospora TaxID=43982 RepID=A0A9W7DH73_AMBMO|nr:unnamed protein product [Ambrosiozyma monospora]